MNFLKTILIVMLLCAPAFAQGDGAPAAPAGGGFNASAMLDSVLDGGAKGGTAVADEEVPAGDQPASGEETPAEENEATTEEVAEGEEGAEGETDPEALLFEDEEIGSPVVVEGPNGEKLYQWPEKSARAIQSQVKFAAEIQSAIPDITVDDAIAHNEAYTDLYRLGHDLRTGSPDSVRRVAQMIVNEAGANGPSVIGLTNTLLGHIKATNPRAYSQVSSAVEGDLENELYQAAQDAANHPDPNIKEGYRLLAEWFSFHRNGGKFKPVAEFAKKIDPLDTRLQRAQQLEQEHQARVAADAEKVTETWKSATRQESGTGLRKAVDEAIPQGMKDRFQKDPLLKDMVTDRVMKQVRERLKADTEWSERFEIQYSQALAERNKQSAQRIVDLYLARAKGVLKRELPKMLSSASNAAVDISKQRHQQLRTATGSSHRVPGGTSTPVRRSIAQKASKFSTPEEYKNHMADLLS